ncbi:MAG: hypothetical protein ACR2NF_11265 [Pirellulales bacterium]
MKYYGKVKDPKAKWAKVERRIDIRALEEEVLAVSAISVGRTVDEVADICGKSSEWVQERVTLEGLWEAAEKNFDGISFSAFMRKVDAIPMSFEESAAYFSEHLGWSMIQQPSKNLSERNRFGWHLYNVNGYLGSIDKNGCLFNVKARENK